MEEYKIGRSCPKCGESGATTEYNDGMPKPSRWGHPFGGYPPDDFEPEETMIRECKNCKYRWHEKPTQTNN